MNERANTARVGYLRPKQAAEYLQIGLSTLWRWTALYRGVGFPQPIKVGPRVTLFDSTGLEQFVQARPKAAE
jgi:predicted DNA-binding transcriptional regulator AlpA